MRINSKKKGSAGERELANKLKEYGYNCRRTQQFCGNTGQADDVIGLDYIHIECKRVERLNIDEAIEQATRDTKDNKFPTVFHRKNRKEWLVYDYDTEETRGYGDEELKAILLQEYELGWINWKEYKLELNNI